MLWIRCNNFPIQMLIVLEQYLNVILNGQRTSQFRAVEDIPGDVHRLQAGSSRSTSLTRGLRYGIHHPVQSSKDPLVGSRH